MERDTFAWVATIASLLSLAIAVYMWYRHCWPPDFRMSVDPPDGETHPGAALQTLITISDVRWYGQAVILSACGQPPEAVVTFIPVGGPKPPYSSTMTINVGSNVPASTYPIKIKAIGKDGKNPKKLYYILTIT